MAVGLHKAFAMIYVFPNSFVLKLPLMYYFYQLLSLTPQEKPIGNYYFALVLLKINAMLSLQGKVANIKTADRPLVTL